MRLIFSSSIIISQHSSKICHIQIFFSFIFFWQPWNPLAASSTQGLQNAATTEVPQTVTPAFEATSGVAGLSSSAEVKSIERNALPEVSASLLLPSFLTSSAKRKLYRIIYI